MSATQSFVFGRKEADPKEKSVSGFKADLCLRAIKEIKGSFLEVGCGGGQFLRMLLRHRPDLNLYGIDLDLSAAKYASKEKGLKISCASAEHLPFADRTFSVVSGFDILEHVDDPLMVLREVYRVMKNDGKGVFYVPCEGNPWCIYKLLGHHDRKKRHIGHIQQFSCDEVVGLFEKAGFVARGVRYTDYTIGQIFDYMFFRQLDKSSDPAALWAAQGLEKKEGDYRSQILCWIRILVSAITWCEWHLRASRWGSMGVILTLEKCPKDL